MVMPEQMTNPHLSVIVPAFNEEARISTCVEQMTSYLSGKPFEWELIVVNDGSTDSTARIIAGLAAADSRVKAIDASHAGKGAAVKRGMLEAKGAWRFLADADLSMPPDNLSRFFDGPEGRPRYDVSIGSREAAGAERFNEPWIRHLIGRVFNWTVKVVAVRGIEDTQCGFKLYSAAAAETVFPLQRFDGWTFDVENLLIARKAGFTIGEVPIDWRHDLDSKRTLAGSIAAYLDIFRVRLNDILGRYREAGRR